MLENAIYSVISPEGCATILWRDPKRMLEAAKAMKILSKNLLELKVIDEIISEPVGGAHRDRDLILDNVKKSIEKNLNEFHSMNRDEILNHRKNKFLTIGRDKGFVNQQDDLTGLSLKKNNIDNFIENFLKSKIKLGTFLILIFLLGYLLFFL